MIRDTISMTGVMAWRNLWRNRRRTVITVTAMVLGLALCIPMYGMGAWMTQEMTRGITRLHMGNIQVHDPKYPEEQSLLDAFPASVSKKVAEVSGVEAVSPRVYSGGMVSAEHRIGVRLHALTEPLPKGRRLISGKGLGQDAGPCAALVSQALANEWHMGSGTSLRLDPLPEDSTCERLMVVGLVSDRDGQEGDLFVAPSTMKKITTKISVEKNESTPEDEDIDDLPKLPEARPEARSAARPASGEPRATPKATAGKQKNVTSADKRPKTAPAAAENKAARNAEKAKGSTRGPPSRPARATSPIQTANKDSTSAKVPKEVAWHVIRSASQPVGIMAVVPKEERRVTAVAQSIVAGHYLPDETGKGPLPILIGKPLAEKLLVKPGDKVGMDVMTPDGFPIDALFVVVGIFDTGVTEMDRSLVQAPMELAWRKDLMNLTDSKTGAPLVNELAIRTKEKVSEDAVAARIRKQVPGLLVRTWRQVAPNTAQILKYQDSATAVFLAIIFVIAALGTTNTMLMSVHERTKEFGVLKSVGMGPGRVAGLILTEALVMTTLATILGGLLGTAITAWLSQYGLDLRSINPEGLRYQGLVISPIWKAVVTERVVAVPALLLAFVSLSVAIWPAVRAARIRPVEALRNET